MKVPAEFVKKEAVSVVEFGTKMVFGFAVCVSCSQGVKPTVPDINAAGAFVPHQLFATLAVPAVCAAPRALAALLLTMRL